MARIGIFDRRVALRNWTETIALAAFLAAPLAGELLETTIAFEGTGCVSCAESLEPRMARIRGVEKVELNLEASTVRLVLEAGNKTRLGPLRLRVTQDGTKIVSMAAVLQGAAAQKDGVWRIAVSGPDEALLLVPGAGVRLQDGRTYRFSGRVVEDASGELTLQADSAEPIP